jgi:hypothetical protein
MANLLRLSVVATAHMQRASMPIPLCTYTDTAWSAIHEISRDQWETLQLKRKETSSCELCEGVKRTEEEEGQQEKKNIKGPPWGSSKMKDKNN